MAEGTELLIILQLHIQEHILNQSSNKSVILKIEANNAKLQGVREELSINTLNINGPDIREYTPTSIKKKHRRINGWNRI